MKGGACNILLVNPRWRGFGSVLSSGTIDLDQSLVDAHGRSVALQQDSTAPRQQEAMLY